jgi:hypothetical protein
MERGGAVAGSAASGQAITVKFMSENVVVSSLGRRN